MNKYYAIVKDLRQDFPLGQTGGVKFAKSLKILNEFKLKKKLL